MSILKVKPDPPPSAPTLKLKDAQQEAPPATVAAPPAVQSKPRRTRQLPAPHVEKPPDIQAQVPHSPEAELAVLSSILIDSQFGKSTKVISEVATKISPFHFFIPACKTVYEMFLCLWKEEKPIEAIGVTQILRDKGLLDSIGGIPFVTSLATYLPSAAAVNYYVEIMLEQFRRREMISLGTRMARAAYGHEEDSIELMRSFEARMTRLIGSNQPPEFVDAVQMLNGELPPLPRVIVSKLLYQGDKMIIGGSSKARKTWGLIDFAFSAATGSDWWGFNTYKSRVCYINLELPSAWYFRRLKALCEAKEVTLEEEHLRVLNLRGRIVTIENLRRQVTPLLKAHRSQLAVIDPIYKVLGDRDENSAGDIAALLNEIEKITVETGVAMAFAAHFSKGNQALKEFMDRIGGSGVFARDPDAVMTMTQHEDLDCFTVETRLRNLMSPRPFVLKWEHPVFIRDDEKSPDALKGRMGAPAKWSENDILDQMSIVNGIKVSHLQEQCEDRLGMVKSTFYRHFNPMRKQLKKIRCDNDGLWYRAGSLANTSETNETCETK